MTGVKTTAKQEAFCLAMQEGLTQTDAYKKAYDTSKWTEAAIHQEATKMLKVPTIILRLAELKERAMERHDTTVDSLTLEYEEARALAAKIEAPASMVSATTGKAKLHGLIVDKKELAGKDGDAIKTISTIEIVHIEPEDE